METSSPDQSSVLGQQSKFTPGPWDEASSELEGTDSVGLCVVAFDEIVCSLYDHMGSHYHNYANDRANARLIAAAPDMLATLQAINDSSEHNELPWRVKDALYAAIAKATGGA
jgi:hypothetical protein